MVKLYNVTFRSIEYEAFICPSFGDEKVYTLIDFASGWIYNINYTIEQSYPEEYIGRKVFNVSEDILTNIYLQRKIYLGGE